MSDKIRSSQTKPSPTIAVSYHYKACRTSNISKPALHKRDSYLLFFIKFLLSFFQEASPFPVPPFPRSPRSPVPPVPPSPS